MQYKWAGEKLKVRRRQLGLTSEQLAIMVGTKRPHISMWEDSKIEPVGHSLLALAEALHCLPVDFYDVLP